MILKDLQHVLETRTLNRNQLVGFIVALLFEKNGILQRPRAAAQAFEILLSHTGSQVSASRIWLKALEKYADICGSL